MNYRRLLARTAVVLAAFAALLMAGSAFAVPKTTVVGLATNPPGAEATLLEPAPAQLLGITPLPKAKLPQGPVKIQFRLNGYQDKVETFTIGPKPMTFTVELVRKIAPATLDLGGDASAQGADITVDGDGKGKLPQKVQVPPGRHQIVVKKAGFQPWEKWADVTENQTATFDISLKPVEKAKGSVLVSSSPTGADVGLNGAPKGKAPQLIENLEPGSYEVELTLDGYKPAHQTVAVREGGRETVSLTLDATAAPTGELTVLCDAPKAMIAVDGEDKGAPPVKVAGLKAGDHIVMCSAPNYPAASQSVTVRAGEVKTVQLSPRQAVAASRGSLSVIANVPTGKAKVGEVTKNLPAQFDDLTPGKYLVTVTAEGYAPWSSTEAVEAQKTTEVKAELKAMGKITVTVPAGRRANVYINGEIKGAAPVTVDLPIGAHKVRIVEDGPNPAIEEHDVPVAAGNTARVDAKLVPPPEPRIVRRSNPTSAHVNDVGKGTVQVGVGMPVPLNFAVAAGVAPDVSAGLDIGVSGVINEFVLTGAYKLAGTNAFAVGVQGGLGGGLGPSDRNSFTAYVKPVASLLLGDSSAFSLYAQFRFFSDTNKNPKILDTATAKMASRVTDFVMPVGLQGEFKVNNSLNAYVRIEMDFVHPAARRIYDENDFTGGLNQKFAAGAGLTWLLN